MRSMTCCGVCVAVFAISTGMVVPSAQGAEKVLYSFKGGTDGVSPAGPLIADRKGNLFGVTGSGGGGTDCDNGSEGCGTVFKLAPDRTETILYAFPGGSTGAIPHTGLTAGMNGNFYGTTYEGGSKNLGVVFELAPGGTETVLHSFLGGSDGSIPSGVLLRDGSGNLYGETAFGGDGTACTVGSNGCGTVFKIAPGKRESVLYAFQGGGDGSIPSGNLIIDDNGNLYGATELGGDANCANGSTGCGTVFKLAPDGTETVLYAFKGGNDGNGPSSGLIADNSGNFYGMTAGGGGAGCNPVGCGTVFEVTPDGNETVLYSFKGGSDGIDPYDGVVLDKAGNLYGVTEEGGVSCGHTGCGTVFKLAPNGALTTLYAFNPRKGNGPSGALLLGKHKLLYGTTSLGGGHKDGAIFDVKE